MKKIIVFIFNFFGLEIRRKPSVDLLYNYSRNEQMIQGLKRCKQRGITINTIIDVGAAAGSWSLSALEFWPSSNYILFEPLVERKNELEQLSLKNKNFHFIPAAAGRERGQVSFEVASDLDGSGISDVTIGDSIRTVEVTPIDVEVEKLQVKGPFIVKLDTHGFEIPILEGCSKIWNDVSLFIIECYGFHIAKESLLFWEMCQYMQSKGFRLVDIVDIMNRPTDGAFWQCDAFFMNSTNQVFESNSYS